MITVAILDDDRDSRNDIEKIVKDFFDRKDAVYKITNYESSMDLLLDMDHGQYFDLFLLDVEMPVHSGLEVAREIRKFYFDPVIVYITNYVRYSIEAYEVNAFRYISKQYLETKLPEALELIYSKMKDKKLRSYVVTHYLDMDVLYHQEIYYLQKEGKYVVIYHKRGECRVRKAMHTVLTELNAEEFIEVGKGWVVNIQHIMSIERQEIVLRNGMRVPVSRRKLEEIKERIIEYWALVK